MKDFSFLDFAREVGKHITVNYMMAKDSVKKRLNGEARDGLSFTEFTYQLLQGYDFLHLYETKGCKLQMGGSDQWGNITTGAELIRRTNGGEVFALTSPLITKADGGKFGKTESGNIWLDPRYTSPYKFYQFWLNVSDADAARYIKIFTSLSREEIEALTAEHEAAPHLRVLQKRLAKEVTIMVHSEEDYNAAVDASNILFGNATAAEAGIGVRIRHLILPALTLGLTGVANITLHTREKMIAIMESDYVLFARARGESSGYIVKRHALRNLVLPAITLQFGSISEIFGGSVLVEQVFSYPGLGQAAIDAGLGSDVSLLLAITVISTLFVFLGNLAANVLYGVIDPQIRRGRSHG